MKHYLKKIDAFAYETILIKNLKMIFNFFFRGCSCLYPLYKSRYGDVLGYFSMDGHGNNGNMHTAQKILKNINALDRYSI